MTTRSLTLGRWLLLGLLFVAAAASPGWAQGANIRGWEVEAHIGGAFGGGATDGTTSLPAAGQEFITFSGRPSRAVSSYYFGDGAALFNQAIAGFFGGAALPRITPLDSVLSAGAKAKSGVAYGFRVGHPITARFGAEFSLDVAHGGIELSDDTLAGVEATRASFVAGFNGLISTGGGIIFTNPNVTSVATIEEDGGRQIFTTGALTINVATFGRFTPYATVGAGVVTNTGDLPSVALVGNYQFRVGGIAPVNDTDTVNVRMVTDKHAFVTVLGGGVRMLGSDRWGVRADLRAYLSKNSTDTLVDATPNVATLTPNIPIASGTNPSIQFSNDRFSRSSLSGPALDGFTVFKGSGTRVRVTATVGYFVRF